MHPMEAGQMVSANVRLVRLLGSGAMGSVWIADHLSLSTQVAVKFMKADVARDVTLVTRFTREATAAAQIRSPHIVQVFDHGVTPGGEPFIVMELLEGEDLAARVRRAGPMSVDETSTLINQLCKALTKAHQMGIVHRDIKPSNIFLISADEDLFTKLLDFGIAKYQASSTPDLTSTREVVGTPLYMSPEQFLSLKHVDWRADLWAVGACAYFALTGRDPFRGDTLGAIYVAIERGLFEPASNIIPSVPAALDAWFSRALSRNADARFSSAKEMAEQFTSLAFSAKSERATLTPQRLSAVTPEPDSSFSAYTGAAAVHTERRRRRAKVAATVAAALVVGGISFVLAVRTLRPIRAESAALRWPLQALDLAIFPGASAQITILPAPTASSSGSATSPLLAPASAVPVAPSARLKKAAVPSPPPVSAENKGPAPSPSSPPVPERKRPDRGF